MEEKKDACGSGAVAAAVDTETEPSPLALERKLDGNGDGLFFLFKAAKNCDTEAGGLLLPWSWVSNNHQQNQKQRQKKHTFFCHYYLSTFFCFIYFLYMYSDK